MAEQLTQSLQDLAKAHGISTEYWDWLGRFQSVSPASIVSILTALGVDCGSPDAIEAAVIDADDAPWRDMLPPTVVMRAGGGHQVPVHVRDGEPVEVWVEICADAALGTSGGTRYANQLDIWVPPRTVDGCRIGRATFELPSDLPLGWHVLVAHSPSRTVRSPLAVCPRQLQVPPSLSDRRAWGLMAQLYSIRSANSWGIGDFADLADLAYLSGSALGADFLLINPLHAGEPVSPLTPSPYLPATRSFVAPTYIRPQDIDEYAYLSVAERDQVDRLAHSVAPLNQRTDLLDRDRSWQAKDEALWTIFCHGLGPARSAAFEDYRERMGRSLTDFATWAALVWHFSPEPLPQWAIDSHARRVRDLAAEPQIARRVEYYCWLQWIADQQLARAQHLAKTSGMRIGLMSDLAVGVHPFGGEHWAEPEVLASGMTVGAPPDYFNQQGQDWSQPPLRPDVLARTGYAAYRTMLRQVLAHAGAIRVDHIMGLFRLWWIPAGASADQGTYVRYDHEAMVGILMLEAARAGALVIGEDLGLVEPWVRDYLAERGIFGTSVLWFEKSDDGLSPRAPERYRRLALATLTTHDLPPTESYLAADHIDLRDRLGLLTEPVAQVRESATRERDAVLGMLRDRGLIGADPNPRQIVEALHKLLLATPSLLLGVSLADAVGERRTQNQPGTDTEYPNWRVPLTDDQGRPVWIENLLDQPRLRALAAALAPR